MEKLELTDDALDESPEVSLLRALGDLVLDHVLSLLLPVGLLPGLGEGALGAVLEGCLTVSPGLRLLERPGLAGAFLVKLTSAWKVLSDMCCPPSCFLSPSTFKRNLL